MPGTFLAEKSFFGLRAVTELARVKISEKPNGDFRSWGPT